MEAKQPNKMNDKKISRQDFLKLGFGVVMAGIATHILGCKQSSTTGIPTAQYPNFLGDSMNRVYHKPTCKLAPEQSKAVSFDSPTAAERAGFRACLICKPNEI